MARRAITLSFDLESKAQFTSSRNAKNSSCGTSKDANFSHTIIWSKESGCIDRQRNELSCNKLRVQESRAGKARRKALQKKQAKIEREVMEEEERRQREDVAKLVEEHKKLRSKKCESENSIDKVSRAELKRETKERHIKKRDQRREKVKLSSKSISDAEELENTLSRGIGKKRGLDKKKEIERQKTIVQNTRLQILEGDKSKHFSKTPKVSSSPSPVSSNTAVGNQNSDSVRNRYANANSTQKADQQSVPNKVQPNTMSQKKSWRQLFACSSTVKSEHDMSGSLNDQLETISSNEQATSFFSMPVIGCLSPIGKSISSPAHNSLKGDTRTSSQPSSVVKQLKKIQVEIGTKTSDLLSPFDSPLSTSSVLEEKTIIGSPKSKKSLDFESDESTNALDFGTWEMWGTPLVRSEPEIQGGFVTCFQFKENLTVTGVVPFRGVNQISYILQCFILQKKAPFCMLLLLKILVTVVLEMLVHLAILVLSIPISIKIIHGHMIIISCQCQLFLSVLLIALVGMIIAQNKLPMSIHLNFLRPMVSLERNGLLRNYQI